MAITVPDVPEQPIPNVRIQPTATLETFGGGAGIEQVGQEVRRIGTAAGEIAAFEKIKADQAAFEDAANKHANYSDQVVSEALTSRGLNSIPAHDQAIEDVRKKANEISSTLHGEQQVGAFNKYALAHDSAINRTLGAHVSTEMEKHYDETSDAFIKNTTEFAAVNYGDPATRVHSLDTIDNTVHALSIRKGWGDDQEKLFSSKVHSNFHEQIFDTMLSDPKTALMANKYYQENKDDIDIATRERIEKSLGENSTRFNAQKWVQDIISKHSSSESDALKAANEIPDSDVQDMARKMITARFTQDRQAMKNDQDSLFMKYQQSLGQKGLTDSADRRNAVSPSDWQRLTAEQQRAIEKGGTVDETSIRKWADFKQMVSDGSLSKISRADLESKFLPYFDQSDKKSALDKWLGVQKGGAKETMYRTVSQMEDDALVNTGLMHAETRKRSESEVRFQKAFSDNVGRDLDAQRDAVGRPLKQEEIQSIIDKNTIKSVETQSGKWFPMVAYTAIPDRDKAHIVELSRQVGGVASKAMIEKAYAMHRKGKSDEDIKKVLK